MTSRGAARFLCRRMATPYVTHHQFFLYVCNMWHCSFHKRFFVLPFKVSLLLPMVTENTPRSL